jgi:para-nitrobenzyl esterase
MELERTKTGYGYVRGVPVNGVLAFRGIPYAAPPVGARRWQAPVPHERWGGSERLCSDFGHSAMQGELGAMGEMIGIAAGPIDEDCLTLNIWTPALYDDLRPVLVWIHGGGNVVGSSAQPRFNGEHIARRGRVVVVSINYRLGAFGFLHAPELGATGNEGLLDQIAALRWVRDEIRVFGGNPNNVTVFGQSAGGWDITQLLAMDAAAGCFDKAVPMSGALSRQIPAAEAAATAARFADRFGGFERLRDVPARDILDFQLELQRSGTRFGPVRDGELICADAAEAIAAGTVSRGIPLMVGTARDEWGLWTAFDESMADLDAAGLEKLAGRVFGERARDGIEVYRAARNARGDDVRPMALWRAIMTDSMFRIPAIRLAELHSRHTPATWMYRFDYESPAMDGRLGACHSLDVPFVFGTVGVLPELCGDTHMVRCLSEVMLDTYVTLAKQGNPNNANLLPWDEYDAENRATMLLSLKPHVEHAPMEPERAFWASLEGVG